MNGHVHLCCGRLVVMLVSVNCCLASWHVAQATEPLTYEADVRPLLKTHCFHCHGESGRVEGGLDLRLRRLIMAGGDSGGAVVTGQPEHSLLAQRMRDGEMPPEDVAIRPTAEDLAIIEAWIGGGALATQAEPDDLDPDHYITQQEREYWAFQPVRRPTLPAVQHTAQVLTPIDRFILTPLETRGLALSPIADRPTLIRRVTLDLLGLPPTPDEVAAFVADASPDAYERLLDRLLNSPHYGEQWGQHWLDVAGYADSEGYTEDDPQRSHAYHYRDYVIRAFNQDKPFDQFITEQLAGDELLTPPFDNLDPSQADKLVATGFLRMAPDGTGITGVDQDVARNDVMAKTLEIVSTSLLGLTVACAQCHDHRYDPIPQVDYYALRAIFEPALDWKNWKAPAQRLVSLYTDQDRELATQIETEAKQILEQRSELERAHVERVFAAELSKLDAEVQTAVREARNVPEKERTADQKKLLGAHPSVNVTPGSLYLYDKAAADELKKLADQAAAIRASKPREEFVRAVWEPTDAAPPPTYLFHRGDYQQPQQIVPPGGLTVLVSARAAHWPVDDPNLPTTGRRLALARWLTSGEHPLVARVIVNRIWLNHFGRGLVTTPGDFGALGEPPTHPQLLDWLADEFVRSGWSVKHIQRLIMTSTVYQQTSARHAQGDAIDSDNTFYWRMPLRRLRAEELRDSALAITGEFVARAYGPPIPIMPDRVGQFVIGIENSSAGRPGEIIPMHGEDLRRSIYVESRRSRPLSVLVPFDLPRMEPNCTARTISTVSPQALLMMNSDFVVGRGMSLAERVLREVEDNVDKQVDRAWHLVFCTAPTDSERAAAIAFLNEQADYFEQYPAVEVKGKTTPSAKLEALASLCHAWLSSNRFLYID